MSARSIVVTIPKAKLAEVEAEEADVARRETAGEQGISFFWYMGRLPQSMPPRIYFVWGNAVRAWHEVISVTRYEGGDGAIFMKTKINPLAETIPMRGFQGFRYIDVEVP